MIYVITAVHNRINITKKFIQNLNKQTVVDNIHLVLVDDGSTDKTAEMVKNEFLNCTVIFGDGNLWWGGSLQKAFEFICQIDTNDNDVIYITNDDIEIPPEFIENAIEVLMENENCLITSCGYGLHTGKLRDCVFDYDVKTGNIKRLEPWEKGNCATTRSLFMTMKSFKNIGGFHPVLLPHYASDMEYTIRAARKGHDICSSQRLKYVYDEYKTGKTELKKTTIRELFSKGSRFNPIYKLSFLLMVTPLRYLPVNIINSIKKIENNNSFY